MVRSMRPGGSGSVLHYVTLTLQTKLLPKPPRGSQAPMADGRIFLTGPSSFGQAVPDRAKASCSEVQQLCAEDDLA